MSRNKDNVRCFFEGVFNQGNLALVDEMLAPNYTYNGHPTAPAATKAWAGGLRQKFPDLHFTINDLLGEGDQVAIRWTMVGTDQKTQQKMTTSGTNIITNDAQGRAISNWQNGGTEPEPVGSSSSGAATASSRPDPRGSSAFPFRF
jgi:predicted ester cyclase